MLVYRITLAEIYLFCYFRSVGLVNGYKLAPPASLAVSKQVQLRVPKAMSEGEIERDLLNMFRRCLSLFLSALRSK